MLLNPEKFTTREEFERFDTFVSEIVIRLKDRLAKLEQSVLGSRTHVSHPSHIGGLEDRLAVVERRLDEITAFREGVLNFNKGLEELMQQSPESRLVASAYRAVAENNQRIANGEPAFRVPEQLQQSPAPQPVCDGCGKPIEGQYASIGGNWVPFVRSKIYHVGCVPPLTSQLVRDNRKLAPKFERQAHRPLVWADLTEEDKKSLCLDRLGSCICGKH